MLIVPALDLRGGGVVRLLKGDFSALNVLRKIFAVQAVAAWFISLPLQLSAVLGPTPMTLLPVLIAGVLVWLVGVLFEAVGDRQLREFKADQQFLLFCTKQGDEDQIVVDGITMPGSAQMTSALNLAPEIE